MSPTPGTLFSPEGGPTDQLRTIIDILGGVGSNYGGKGELIGAIITAMQSPQLPNTSDLAIQPLGALASTMTRTAAGESITIATASGTIYMSACYLPANTVVTDITAVVGSGASSNDVTINWAALCDNTRKVLAVSPNATAQLTPAGFNNTLVVGPFTTQYSGLYYVAYTVGATTTQPTLCGNTAAGTEVNKIVPILCGTSSTAGTAIPPAVGATLGAITATASNIYAFLS